jgi:hypothetical protein
VKASERVLKAILWVLALDAAIGGAVLLVGGRAVFIWLFREAPASEVSDLLLFKQKTWGGLGVALTIMLISAARDPRRNSVIVWAITVGLAIAGIAELLSMWLLGAARLFPMYKIVAHALTRIGIALLLAYLEKQLLAEHADRTLRRGRDPSLAVPP